MISQDLEFFFYTLRFYTEFGEMFWLGTFYKNLYKIVLNKQIKTTYKKAKNSHERIIESTIR